jgi:hypothetical protein
MISIAEGRRGEGRGEGKREGGGRGRRGGRRGKGRERGGGRGRRGGGEKGGEKGGKREGKGRGEGGEHYLASPIQAHESTIPYTKARDIKILEHDLHRFFPSHGSHVGGLSHHDGVFRGIDL